MPLLSRLAVQAARAYGALSFGDKNAVPASYLVVAGGGSGGGGTAYSGGGGGAGGYQTSTFTLSTLNTYSITVGAGGAGAVGYGLAGSNSVISGTGITTITSTGGGQGATFGFSPGNGGSGGGAREAGGSGGTGTVGQGNNGGSSSVGNAGGGGGGASAVGVNATTAGVGGNGGAGTASSISGSSVTYAGGGGGEGQTTKGVGGAGGGGDGGQGNPANGTPGTANLGGGGGGSVGTSSTGGSGGSGIVIISYTSATPKFVGGTLTTSGGNQIHTFTSSGSLSPLTPVTASYLVVAGGGGGGTASGGFYAGGGGAGGLLTSSTTLYSGATYVVTVGGGGAINASGSNSVLSGTGLTTVTSTGGGRGGAFQTNGAAGGSGGGAGGDGSGGTYTGGLGTSGQGNNGGNAAVAFGSTNTGGGGGGGAGAAGSNSPTSTKNGGAGGAGTASSISGSSVTYSAGGGGMAGNDGTGGTVGANGTGWIAAPNLGHGGGPDTQRTGSSGTVIISYAGSQVFNGGLVTSSGGNTIHTFNATGALTPLTNNLTNSLRFRSSASAYLNRTPTSSGNRQKWTWSAWLKRGSITSATQQIMAAGDGTVNNRFLLAFLTSTDTLSIQNSISGTNTVIRTTTQVFRDPSAWYHIVLAIDTTQATAANRTKLYINGNEVTSFGTSNDLTLNYDTYFNSTSYSNTIGVSSTSYFDGYLTDINFIDGQALEPYYFGNNDANGVWKPIKYTGMYGTNGFYLTFGNTTSTTTLGYDSSGNNNNWTTNNISLTAGVTYDAMLDVPTNTSATVANYCVMNPLAADSNATFSNANLTIASNAAGEGFIPATIDFDIASSTGYYFEVTVDSGTAYCTTGFIPVSKFPGKMWTGGTYPGQSTYNPGFEIRFSDGTILQNGGSSAYGSGATAGDTWGFAIKNGKVWARNSSGWFNSGDPVTEANPAVTGQTGQWLLGFAERAGAFGAGCTYNFGQRPFSYTPPTGYVALNTYNLPTPTILQGNKYMDATTYVATGTAPQTVTNNAQFKPDLVWTKNRTSAGNHYLNDSVRGAANALNSNTTSAEASLPNYITSFNSNGYGIGSDNFTSGQNIVGWQWQAGQGSTSSNTNGTITSTVSVNATAGFSVVTYTGTGANATVGHGLGVAPKMIMVKWRSGGGLTAQDWNVYHASVGATARLFLNTTAASATTSVAWNNTAPTSSLFSIGTGTDVNGSSASYVAYCWAEIAGFSKFGSYTGNGSTDGPFVYTGFRPKFIMAKRTDTAGFDWILTDSSRSPSNVVDKRLFGNTTDAESSATTPYDYLSNGFKLRNTNANENASGGSYIYMAFAENPFKNSNAR